MQHHSDSEVGVKYIVVMSPGARCKESEDLNSRTKAKINIGNIVNVVEKRGRRVRINRPVTGWLSEYNGEGELILQRYDVKSVLVDNAILEKKKRREARSNAKSKTEGMQHQADPETISTERSGDWEDAVG